MSGHPMMPLMVSPTPMTLHSYPTGHYIHPSITQNKKELLKTCFLDPCLQKFLLYTIMHPLDHYHYTTHSIFHPHDLKHQPCGPPQPLICDQKWEIIIEKTVHLISVFTASHSTQMHTSMHPKDQ
jgi:hypothetical protein